MLQEYVGTTIKGTNKARKVKERIEKIKTTKQQGNKLGMCVQVRKEKSK